MSLPDEQRHYLFSVMRVRQGKPCRLFNGVDGEFAATVKRLDRKAAELTISSRLRVAPARAGGPILLFGLLKGARLPMLVEKATELGVYELRPVITEYCATRNVNLERLSAIATEAAEQSGRLTVPLVTEPQPLQKALSEWDATVPLCVCDERGNGLRLTEADVGKSPGVLIGPEGGFSSAEFEAFTGMSCVTLVSLGPNILRAETAAMAALSVIGLQREA